MPMETEGMSLPTGIRPVQQTRNTTETTAVTRREGGSSPFAPQTNVSIENSIADMAGVLAKISTNQEGAAEVMPQQIKAMVENIMRQAFSVDATLGEGLGSTLESQRFSVEQLNNLSRILGQLSVAMDKDASGSVGPELQTFMKCLRGFISQTNNAFEPVLLHKLSFQLLNAKAPADLPPELQAMLAGGNPQAAGSAMPDGSDALAFLKQLVKCFIPSPVAEGTGGAAEEAVRASQADGQAFAGEEAPAGGTAAPAEGEANQPAAGEKAVAGNALPRQAAGGTAASGGEAALKDNTAQNAQPAAEAAEGNPAGFKAVPARADISDADKAGTPGKADQPDRSQPATGKNEAGQAGAMKQEAPAGRERFDIARLIEERLMKINERRQPDAVPGGQAEAVPLENTPKTMTVMKELAGLLIKDAEISPEDMQLLQKFINNDQTVLSEKEAKQLQLLLRLCENNVPASVRQAAIQNNMPDLPRLWAFMQFCDLTALKEKNPRSLKSASRNVADFAGAMRSQMEGAQVRSSKGQRSMNFMMPLYLGDNEKSYPAYIHVYDENKQESEKAELKKETWIRICLLTENIGAVELTCRLYEKRRLDVRVFFSEPESVRGFNEYVPEFRESFRDLPLELVDLKVGTAGGKS